MLDNLPFIENTDEETAKIEGKKLNKPIYSFDTNKEVNYSNEEDEVDEDRPTNHE